MAANDLITDDVIAKESLMVIENSLSITKRINRRHEPKFAREGAKIGDSINIRLPVRWEGREGEIMVPEGAQERSVLMKIDRLIGQDLEFSNVDLTLKVDQFKERYLDTANASIANRIDKAICQQYKFVPNFATAAVPQTVPTTLDPYFDASVTLSNYGVPAGKRAMIVSPRMEASIVNALKGLFQAARLIAEQYETGGMGHVIGFDWEMDQNIPTHTIGALGGVPLVDGAGQSGSTLLTKGWTAAAATRLLQGDIITLALMNGVNPQSRDDTSELRHLAVTADTASTAGGAMTIPIFPAIQLAGAYQNVSGAAADSAVIKIFGSASAFANFVTKQGLAFHKEWMTAAFVDLDLPKNMEMAARAHSSKTGVAVRIVKGYDIKTNQQLTRLDVEFGLKQTYEDFCCRIPS